MGARVVVVAALIAVSSSAMAEDRQAAKQAFVEGQKYYNLNQYADALEAFKKAYWNYPEPTFLFNIAQCHRLLKHKSEAVEFYRSYLRNAPNAPNRAEVQKLVSELESAIAKEQAATNAPPLGTETTPTTPPSTTAAPATTPTTPPPSTTNTLVENAPPPAHAGKPVWKRGWFWGVMAGAAVVVGAGVGLGVGLGTSSSKDPTPSFGSLRVN